MGSQLGAGTIGDVLLEYWASCSETSPGPLRPGFRECGYSSSLFLGNKPPLHLVAAEIHNCLSAFCGLVLPWVTPRVPSGVGWGCAHPMARLGWVANTTHFHDRQSTCTRALMWLVLPEAWRSGSKGEHLQNKCPERPRRKLPGFP